MVDALLGFLTNILGTLFSHLTSKHGEHSEWRQRYDALRQEIAAALTMNACYYCNPVDIARMKNHQLPHDYAEGSKQLRELGAKVRALMETAPKKVKDMPISKQDLYEVSSNLIGLSNSFTTPYNSGVSEWHYNAIQKYESEIRKHLNLDDSRG